MKDLEFICPECGWKSVHVGELHRCKNTVQMSERKPMDIWISLDEYFSSTSDGEKFHIGEMKKGIVAGNSWRRVEFREFPDSVHFREVMPSSDDRKIKIEDVK